jgi:hypothetical protein
MSRVMRNEYPGHRKGSRKGAVHQVFDAKGAEAAYRAGRQRRLKESTLRSWFSSWGRKRR